MQSVNTDGVEPLSNPLEMTQRLREDIVTEENRRDAFLANAPQTEAGLFLVPKVID
jgi:aspartyl-tRNA(Asn)/glutamyl-tRNA(Gln) amidotransferase subunit C